jgi:hypothetical protein
MPSGIAYLLFHILNLFIFLLPLNTDYQINIYLNTIFNIDHWLSSTVTIYLNNFFFLLFMKKNIHIVKYIRTFIAQLLLTVYWIIRQDSTLTDG